MKHFLSLWIAVPILTVFAAISCKQASYPPFEGPIPLYQAGEAGYHTFRIPAIAMSQKGTVLAFAEARRNSQKDHGDIDLVLKRSTDGGRTWGEMITIRNDGENCCSSPTPVVLDNGRILLLSTWKTTAVPYHYFDITWYIQHSDDDGLTWSEPRRIDEGLVERDWIMACIGPGHAIQLRNGAHKGRVVASCYHKWEGEGKLWQGRSFFIYSDDRGETWKRGAFSGRGGNECMSAELSNGDIMLNMREFKRWADTTELAHRRQVAISTDGGETLSDIVFDPQLPEAICEGSILRYRSGHEKEDWLLFMNPNGPEIRENLKVKLSKDRGQNWHVIYDGPYPKEAYSDMVELRDGSVGLIYEAGDSTARDFLIFDLIPKNLIN